MVFMARPAWQGLPPRRAYYLENRAEVVGSSEAGGMSSLQELMSGIVSHELSKLRR